jgi:Ankyrin repeats (many copies)
VKSRGYSATKHATLASAYYNKPTPHQIASYRVYLIDLIRDGNTEAVQEVLGLGLSPNACNQHGESIVHSVCRRSDVQMLDVLIHAGCDIQISDDCGRTLLHDACWAAEPNFPLVEKLLEKDLRLLYMMDARGNLPLSYTRKIHWSDWLQFLQSKKDVYWPRGNPTGICDAPELVLALPNSRPLRNPTISLSLELTRMVAGGKLKPKEAHFMQNYLEGTVVDVCTPNDDDSDNDSDDSDDDDDESISSCATNPAADHANMDDSWNLDEMNEILESLTNPKRAPLAW